MGTQDGPGLRAVVFASGCPLRCIYCHNPDTHAIGEGEPTEHTELARRIERLIPYIKDGGVTFSGGEPCLQAEFFAELAELLHAMGLHVALDTSGCIINDRVERLVSLCDLVLLDLKFTTEEDYRRYTGGSLGQTLDFLSLCERMGVPVRIRHVVVPGLNDTEEDVKALEGLIEGKRCIEEIEPLPFRKLCLEKYEMLGIPFALAETPEMDEERLQELYSEIQKKYAR